jgi:hypothetical protein
VNPQPAPARFTHWLVIGLVSYSADGRLPTQALHVQTGLPSFRFEACDLFAGDGRLVFGTMKGRSSTFSHLCTQADTAAEMFLQHAPGVRRAAGADRGTGPEQRVRGRRSQCDRRARGPKPRRCDGHAARGRLDLDALVTHRMGLNDFQQALDLQGGDAGKVLLIPGMG